MRKVLFAAAASSVVLAVAPATAFACDHHHRRHHHAHRTHAAARHEHFGTQTMEIQDPTSHRAPAPWPRSTTGCSRSR